MQLIQKRRRSDVIVIPDQYDVKEWKDIGVTICSYVYFVKCHFTWIELYKNFPTMTFLSRTDYSLIIGKFCFVEHFILYSFEIKFLWISLWIYLYRLYFIIALLLIAIKSFRNKIVVQPCQSHGLHNLTPGEF